MRLRIGITVSIDLATGETQAKATWQVEGEETGLGAPLAQAAAALSRITPAAAPSDSPASQSIDPYHSPSIEEADRVHPAAKEARVLAGLLDLRADVEQALGQRPAGRVLEVLKWIRTRRGVTNIRSVPSLFWSLVVKD